LFKSKTLEQIEVGFLDAIGFCDVLLIVSYTILFTKIHPLYRYKII